MGGAPRGEARRRPYPLIRVLPGVYPPSEDTFLLLSVLESMDVAGKDVLDMGCGTGILGIFAAMHGAHVVCADVNPRALENTRLNAELNGVYVETVLSDLFSNVRGSFDLVLFNPPYVPGGRDDPAWDVAWSGGEDGRELIDRFLHDVGKYLKENGQFFLLQSSLNGLEKTIDVARRSGLCVHVMAEEPLFFERLYVLEGRVCR